jgi:hypothetical protein
VSGVPAAIFAIHPIQSEAVNYVWARAIVMAALPLFAGEFALGQSLFNSSTSGGGNKGANKDKDKPTSNK